MLWSVLTSQTILRSGYGLSYAYQGYSLVGSGIQNQAISINWCAIIAYLCTGNGKCGSIGGSVKQGRHNTKLWCTHICELFFEFKRITFFRVLLFCSKIFLKVAGVWDCYRVPPIG